MSGKKEKCSEPLRLDTFLGHVKGGPVTDGAQVEMSEVLSPHKPGLDRTTLVEPGTKPGPAAICSAPTYPFSPNRAIMYRTINRARAINAGWSSPIGGAARPHPPIPIFCNVAATRPVSPIGEAGRFVAAPLGRPTNFPSLGAAWFPRRAARWQNDSSRWLCKNAGLGDSTKDFWNMHIIAAFTQPFFIITQEPCLCRRVL